MRIVPWDKTTTAAGWAIHMYPILQLTTDTLYYQQLLQKQRGRGLRTIRREKYTWKYMTVRKIKINYNKRPPSYCKCHYMNLFVWIRNTCILINKINDVLHTDHACFNTVPYPTSTWKENTQTCLFDTKRSKMQAHWVKLAAGRENQQGVAKQHWANKGRGVQKRQIQLLAMTEKTKHWEGHSSKNQQFVERYSVWCFSTILWRIHTWSRWGQGPKCSSRSPMGQAWTFWNTGSEKAAQSSRWQPTGNLDAMLQDPWPSLRIGYMLAFEGGHQVLGFGLPWPAMILHKNENTV